MRSIIQFITILVLLFIVQTISAATIQGHIKDSKSQEGLIGAIIREKDNSQIGAATDFEGGFIIKNVPAGEYTFVVDYLGYFHQSKSIHITNDMDHYTLNFHLVHDSLTTEIVITGEHSYGGESDTLARKTEQNAPNVMNIVSAHAIQISPDITVANVMQRVSGVSIERSSSGDGRYAIIRGMEPRYNYTLINGVKIPSPDNKNRYVPLDIFPADLIERIEVNKTLIPSMEGDAIGGSVNLVMKNAPSKFYLNSSLSTGYNQIFFNRGYDYFPVDAINKQSPYQANGPSYLAQPEDFTRDNLNFTKTTPNPNLIGSLSIGDRFFKKKLGIILSGSYQNTYRGTNSIFFPSGYSQGNLKLTDIWVRNYSTHLIRTGLHSKLDYVINKNHKISLYNLYSVLDEIQTRITVDTLLAPPRTGPGTGQVTYLSRSRFQRQTIYNSTLQGEHDFLQHKLRFDWSALYSIATGQIPDWAELEYVGGYYKSPLSAPAPSQQPNVLQDYNRTWWRNTDKDYTGYANVHYKGIVKNIPFTLSIGGMYRDKHRDNHYDNYLLRPVSVSGPDPRQMWTNIYNFNWYVFNPGGSPNDPNNYRVTEKITALYTQLKFKIHKLETIAGIRQEQTYQHFDTDVDVSRPGKSGTIQYVDLLPSVHFKYILNAKTNIRASYFKSISRPGFFEIVPYNFQGENWLETGNPYLKHSRAHNFDVRYEFFPKANEQILIGAFYKIIQNPIEYGFASTGVQNDKTYQPGNFGDATNYGVELVYEKYIKHYGLRANYTYTHSKITSIKTASDNSSGIYQPVYKEQSRPLQGQAAHIANIAFIYKNPNKGITAQIAWQYTGKRIVLVSPYYEFDYWQKGLQQIDLSAEKNITKKFSVFMKIQNLLNSPYQVYINQPKNVNNANYNPPMQKDTDKTLVQKEYYGQNYQLGLRFIF